MPDLLHLSVYMHKVLRQLTVSMDQSGMLEEVVAPALELESNAV